MEFEKFVGLRGLLVHMGIYAKAIVDCGQNPPDIDTLRNAAIDTLAHNLKAMIRDKKLGTETETEILPSVKEE